jgi:hypothetical protein
MQFQRRTSLYILAPLFALATFAGCASSRADSGPGSAGAQSSDGGLPNAGTSGKANAGGIGGIGGAGGAAGSISGAAGGGGASGGSAGSGVGGS